MSSAAVVIGTLRVKFFPLSLHVYTSFILSWLTLEALEMKICKQQEEEAHNEPPHLDQSLLISVLSILNMIWLEQNIFEKLAEVNVICCYGALMVKRENHLLS